MLDEILEYQQYTQDPASIKDPRLKHSNLKGNLCGVNRAMHIVARGYMNREFAGLSPDETFERTKNVLRQWFGEYKPGEGESDDGVAVQNWFPSYITDCLLPKASDDKMRRNMYTILEDLPNKYVLYNKSEFYIPEETKNTENMITYEKVIHEAGRAGRLMRRYLVSEKPVWPDNITILTEKKEKAPKETQFDLMLKTIAAYLLEDPKRNCQNGTQPRYARICLADICNWSMLQKINSVSKYRWNGEPVFEQEMSENHPNHKRIRLNRDFMEEYRWNLITDVELPDFSREHPGCGVYIDEGAECPLKTCIAEDKNRLTVYGFQRR